MSARNERDNAVVRSPEGKSFVLIREFWVAVEAAKAFLLATCARRHRGDHWLAIRAVHCGRYVMSRGMGP
jgi:hypothetical protein